MEILFSSGFAPFTAALLVVLCLVALEGLLLAAAGMGTSDMLSALLATDTFAEAAWANWLLVKGLPLSVAAVLLFTGFGTAGFAAQWFSLSRQGEPMSLLVAVPVASVVGWVLLKQAGRLLAPLFGTNTTAVRLEALTGQPTTILSPRCTTELMAEVCVRDVHGQTHWLMVVPAAGEGELVQGDKVVLQGRDGSGRLTVRKA